METPEYVNREGISADKGINTIRSLSQEELHIRRERSK